MISPEERKKDIISTIERNPTNVTINVTSRKEVNGAWQPTRHDESLRVRIFQQKNPEVTIISDDKGTANTTKKYGMLADYKALIVASSKDDIVFDSIYGRMEIIGVYPQIIKGVTCGYQCDLKRVS